MFGPSRLKQMFLFPHRYIHVWRRWTCSERRPQYLRNKKRQWKACLYSDGHGKTTHDLCGHDWYGLSYDVLCLQKGLAWEGESLLYGTFHAETIQYHWCDRKSKHLVCRLFPVTCIVPRILSVRTVALLTGHKTWHIQSLAISADEDQCHPTLPPMTTSHDNIPWQLIPMITSHDRIRLRKDPSGSERCSILCVPFQRTKENNSDRVCHL